MTTINDLVSRFTTERPEGNIILEPATLLALAVKAVNFYTAYGYLTSQLATLPAEPDPMVSTSSIPSADLIIANSISAAMYANNSIYQYGIFSIPSIIEPNTDRTTHFASIYGSTDVSVSEWAVINPLFMLYVEREAALQFELTRMMGIDPPARSSTEVQSDIDHYEREFMPKQAFTQAILTV